MTVPCWAGLDLDMGACHPSLVCDLLGRLDTDLCSLHLCPELKEHFTLGLLDFILFWEFWRSSCPTYQADVLFVFG